MAKGDTDLLTCNYEIGYEGREAKMIVHCKECPGAHSIKDDRCRAALIRALSQEYNINSITLSHHIETQYFGRSMELLSQMVYLINELDNLALRDPIDDYFRDERARKKHPCVTCGANPNRLFSELRKTFIRDLGEFFAQLKSLPKDIKRIGEPTRYCRKCQETTIDDLTYTFDMFEELARFLVFEGFNIVLKGSTPQQTQTQTQPQKLL